MTKTLYPVAYSVCLSKTGNQLYKHRYAWLEVSDLDTTDRIFSIFYTGHNICDFLGPVVQSVVSLTSSLVVKMLTVRVSIISNSQVFLLNKKMLLTFFSKYISLYAIFNDQSFNDTLTNDIVSFEQLGPDSNPLFENDQKTFLKDFLSLKLHSFPFNGLLRVLHVSLLKQCRKGEMTYF